MMSYEAIAEDWIGSKTETEKKAFANLNLGLPYKYGGDAPDHVRLMERREPDLIRGHIPPRPDPDRVCRRFASDAAQI